MTGTSAIRHVQSRRNLGAKGCYRCQLCNNLVPFDFRNSHELQEQVKLTIAFKNGTISQEMAEEIASDMGWNIRFNIEAS